jgi:chromosome segregation ATPase
VKKDLTNLQQELAKLKEEMTATRQKAEPLALLAVNAAVSPAPPQAAASALKEEMRELRGLKAAMAEQQQRHEQEIRDVNHEVELLRKASECSQKRETQAVADVRKVVGQLAGQLDDLRSENASHRSGVEEMARAHEQLRAKAARLRQRIEVLEHDNQRLSEAN